MISSLPDELAANLKTEKARAETEKASAETEKKARAEARAELAESRAQQAESRAQQAEDALHILVHQNKQLRELVQELKLKLVECADALNEVVGGM